MSNYDTPGPLDGAIDETVRDMMHLDPRPGLRHRVAGSIGSRPQPAARFRAGFAWAAGAAAVVIGLLVFQSPEPVQPVATPQIATTSPAVSAPAPAPPLVEITPPVAAPVPAPAVRPRREPSPASIFGAPTGQVAAASLAAGVAEPFTGTPPAPGEQDPLPGALAGAAPITVVPIQVERITIVPLSVSALPIRH